MTHSYHRWSQRQDCRQWVAEGQKGFRRCFSTRRSRWGVLPGTDYVAGTGTWNSIFTPKTSRILCVRMPADKLDIFNILVLTGVTHTGVLSWCPHFGERKMAMLIIDPPLNSSADASKSRQRRHRQQSCALEKNCAFFFRTSIIERPVTGKEIALPPSRHRGGHLCSHRSHRGVWMAPPGSKPPSTTPRASSSGAR